MTIYGVIDCGVIWGGVIDCVVIECPMVCFKVMLALDNPSHPKVSCFSMTSCHYVFAQNKADE